MLTSSLQITLSATHRLKAYSEMHALQFDGVCCETGNEFAIEGLHFVITDTFLCPPDHMQSMKGASAVWK